MYKTFAAIDVGSSDISMTIYEINAKKGYKKLDTVSNMIELGSDTYQLGQVTNAVIDQLCESLLKFKKKMKEYGVEAYWAYATSAIREADNCENIINRIKLRTDLDVHVLSNSEHRFITYQGIAAFDSEKFEKIISKNTAVVDIGAGSVQVSIFDNGKLGVTQNLKIGSTRIRDSLYKLEASTTEITHVIEEYVSNEIQYFKSMYLKDKQIKNVIAVGDDIGSLLKVVPELGITDTISLEQFEHIYKKIKGKNPQDIAEAYGIPFERATLLVPAATIYLKFLRESKAEIVWAPSVTFCDGMLIAYIDQSRSRHVGRDFTEDIITSAYQISKRYRCNRQHAQNVATIALEVFDSIKSIHGMGNKERLQLQIAAILHDCGKYINMNETAMNSYHIIMSTEIMGISHKEREEIANIVKFNTFYLPPYKFIKQDMGDADYDKVAKLAAILRVANAMDRSHTQKINKFSVKVKDQKLIITADTLADISLETGLFETKAGYFEQVYGIRPVLKQKRSI